MFQQRWVMLLGGGLATAGGSLKSRCLRWMWVVVCGGAAEPRVTSARRWSSAATTWRLMWASADWLLRRWLHTNKTVHSFIHSFHYKWLPELLQLPMKGSKSLFFIFIIIVLSCQSEEPQRAAVLGNYWAVLKTKLYLWGEIYGQLVKV